MAFINKSCYIYIELSSLSCGSLSGLYGCGSLGGLFSCGSLGGLFSCGSLGGSFCCGSFCGLFSVNKDCVGCSTLLSGIPVRDIELDGYVACVILRLNVEENVLAVVLRRISLVKLSFGVLYKTPVHIPAAVSSELELIICVSVNILECDLINAGFNLGHLVFSSVGVPNDAIEEVALTSTNSCDVIDVVYGRNYAIACYGDFTGLRIVSYGYVAILVEHKVNIEICAVHAVPYSILRIAANKLNDLNLIELAFSSSYAGNNDAEDAILTLGH